MRIVRRSPIGHRSCLVFIERRLGRSFEILHLEVFLEHLQVAPPTHQLPIVSLRVFLQSHVGLKRLNTAHLHSLQSTRNDAVKEREVVRHIHGDSVHRYPASNVDADGCNLVSIHIHSRLSIDTLALNSKHI